MATEKTMLEKLYQSIKERWRPEDVAKVIYDFHGRFMSPARKRNIARAANQGWGYSSMSRKFAGASDLSKQLHVAEVLFPEISVPHNLGDRDTLWEYIEKLDKALGKSGQKSGDDFIHDRRNKRGRAIKKVQWKGHRAYNKRFRLVTRMKAKFGRWERNKELREMAQIAKSRLACRLSWEDFSKDGNTACFIAYMTARLNLRSIFTCGKQQRAYDSIADMLFKRLRSDRANWYAVAHVYVHPEVTNRLTEEDKGKLLGVWFSQMKRASEYLDELLHTQNIDLNGLVVHRGNDSSTWNEVAGAYNKCRDGWISTLYAMGNETILDKFAPPKMLRLMAADVVRWHRSSTGGLEPDTQVWNILPKPWEVVLGRKSCTRKDIETACHEVGIKGKGWIAPRSKKVAPFKPTPELVHGVVVTSPELADVLKKCGYFSGPSKDIKGYADVNIEKSEANDMVVVSEI